MTDKKQILGTPKSVCSTSSPSQEGRCLTCKTDEMPKVFLVKNPIDEGSDSVGNHLWSFDSISGYVELTPSELERIKMLIENDIKDTDITKPYNILWIDDQKILLKKLSDLK